MTARGALNYYSHTRPEVLELVPETATRILDVGCGEGRLGAQLRRQGRRVEGIEMNDEAAGVARSVLDSVHVGDAERVLPTIPEQSFDCVIMADVLEHLRDPWSFLGEVQRVLDDRGCIVLSLPNLSHWSVLKALLHGRFDYQAAGLLDRTHLHFFTRSTILETLAVSGFTVNHLGFTTVGLPEIPADLVRVLEHSLGVDGKRFKQEAGIYQYLIRAQITRRSTDLPQHPNNQTTNPLLSIVIVTRNGLEHTKKCVTSIVTYVRVPHEVIVVDNGSTDGTLEWLYERQESHQNLRIYRNETNIGFGPANNQGIAMSRGRFVLLLNNDTVLGYQAVDRMLATLEVEGVGIVGPKTNRCAGVQQVPWAEYRLEKLDEYSKDWSRRHARTIQYVDRVIGFAMLIRREVINRIGGFDLTFTPGNFEDDDYCVRARLAGFRIAVAQDAFVHHAGGATFAQEHVSYQALLNDMRRRFNSKWGLPAWSTTYTLGDIKQRTGALWLEERLYEPLAGQPDSEGLTRLAQELLNEGRVPACIATLRKALDIRNGPDERINLAGILAGCGRSNEALDVLLQESRLVLESGQSIALEPEVRSLAAKLYEELGNVEVASLLGS